MCAELLCLDPATWLHARINGWDHPLSREGMWLAHLTDSSEANRIGKKFKPSPKPWPKAGIERMGQTTLSPEEAKALLRRNREGLNV